MTSLLRNRTLRILIVLTLLINISSSCAPRKIPAPSSTKLDWEVSRRAKDLIGDAIVYTGYLVEEAPTEAAQGALVKLSANVFIGRKNGVDLRAAKNLEDMVEVGERIQPISSGWIIIIDTSKIPGASYVQCLLQFRDPHTRERITATPYGNKGFIFQEGSYLFLLDRSQRMSTQPQNSTLLALSYGHPENVFSIHPGVDQHILAGNPILEDGGDESMQSKSIKSLADMGDYKPRFRGVQEPPIKVLYDALEIAGMDYLCDFSRRRPNPDERNEDKCGCYMFGINLRKIEAVLGKMQDQDGDINHSYTINFLEGTLEIGDRKVLSWDKPFNRMLYPYLFVEGKDTVIRLRKSGKEAPLEELRVNCAQ